jgi:phosphoribosyl 1,2-cyclic phosphodiesterase
MSLFIASINSGSNGNCYYVGNQTEAILVDAGLSCRETEKRMRKLGLNLENVRGIFISHEHGDHIYGLETISKRYRIPVFTNFSTGREIGKKIAPGMLQRIDQGDCVEIDDLKIKAFSKSHDAIDPLSFTITSQQITVGVFTDIGKSCDELKTHFKQCHAAFLEANYDDEMLEKGNYPFHLKNRIRSNQGHLSNQQALDLFEQHRPPFMTHLLLSHLSKENNSPEKALSYFQSHLYHTNIQVASRFEASEVFHITGKPKVKTTSLPTFIQPTLF